MSNLRKYGKRILMLLLFIAAVGATVESISGIPVQTITSWLLDGENKVFGQASNMAAPVNGPEHAESSTSDEMVSLEKGFDWSQYPKKTVIATGYTAGVESTGKSPGHPLYGITYSGVKVKRDLYSTVAADPSVFPLGTILFVPGYGFGVVADTGSAIKGNKIDLYYETVEEVYNNWGKQTVDVYIVEMGTGKVTEEELAALNENETMQVFRQQYIKSLQEN